MVSLADLSPTPPANKYSVYRIHQKCSPISMLRRSDAEPLPEQGIVRVILGDFTDAKTANDVAAALRVEGAFLQAFVVKGD